MIEPGACMASLIDVDREMGKDVGNWLLFSNPDSTRGRNHITIKASPDEAAERVAALVKERKVLDKELADAKRQLALAGGGGTGDSGPADEKIGDIAFTGQVIDGLNPKDLRGLLDEAKQRMGSGIAAIAATNDGRAAFAVGVTEDLTGQYDAVALVRLGVEALGGKGGGGRPDMAQGGGPDASQAAAALDVVRAAIAN